MDLRQLKKNCLQNNNNNKKKMRTCLVKFKFII